MISKCRTALNIANEGEIDKHEAIIRFESALKCTKLQVQQFEHAFYAIASGMLMWHSIDIMNFMRKLNIAKMGT